MTRKKARTLAEVQAVARLLVAVYDEIVTAEARIIDLKLKRDALLARVLGRGK